MLIGLIYVVHFVVCFILIVVVLLQKGKGQDFASTFGGGGTQTAFGARSSTTILHRATTVAAVLFMLTSLSLTILLSQTGTSSVIEDGAVAPAPPPQAQPLPIAPPVDDPAVPADAGEGADGGTDVGAPADPVVGEVPGEDGQ